MNRSTFYYRSGYEMWEFYLRHNGERVARDICRTYIAEVKAREKRFLSKLKYAMHGRKRRWQCLLYRPCYEMWEEKLFCAELIDAMREESEI